MINLIKKASESSFHAQRNWDRTKVIPQEHIDTLLEVIKNSPTKQAETHYKVFWTNDVDLIYKIYRKTKHFTVTPFGSLDLTDETGKTEKDYNVRNSQIYSNLLFAFSYDWNQKEARSHIHAIVDEGKGNIYATHEKERQKSISIGVAVGELILSANLLGYKTGLCSAFWSSEMKEYFNGENEEVLNKQILAEDRRTGEDNEKWLFPSFTKKMKIEKL